MSIPTATRNDDRPPLSARLLRFGVPAFVGWVLLMVLFAEQNRARGDLHLVASVLARPGQFVAVRAWFFEDETGSMRTVPVRVSLRDQQGRIFVPDIALEPSTMDGVEGSLRVPQGIGGTLILEARAELDGDSITVERSIEVSLDDGSLNPEPRPFSGFVSHYMDPVQVVIAEEAPERLDARVEGGACVPELPCTLWVLVGKPAAIVELIPRVGVRLKDARRGPTDGLVSFELVVVGNEALIEIIASGPSGISAKRSVRLPVLSGGIAASLADRQLFAGETTTLQWTTLGARPVVVDYFRDGVWAHTQSFGEEVTETDTPPLSPGRWRVQVRGDVFSQDHAASLVLLVHDQAARSPRTNHLSDKRLRFDFAAEEGRVYMQPPATSSERSNLPEIEARRSKRRLFGAIAVGLLGLIVAGYLLVVGLTRRSPTSESTATASFWRVTLLALSILLVFLLIAALALWRSFL